VVEVKNKWLRRCGRTVLRAVHARFIPRQSALQNALEHLDHLFFPWLAGNLQENDCETMRFRRTSPHNSGMSKAKAFGDEERAPANLFCHVFVGVFELRSQPLQSVRFFERRQILALECFQSARFPASPHRQRIFNAWPLPAIPRARRVIPTFAEIM